MLPKITTAPNRKLSDYFVFSTRHKDYLLLLFKLFTNKTFCLQINMENFFFILLLKKIIQNFLLNNE